MGFTGRVYLVAAIGLAVAGCDGRTRLLHAETTLQAETLDFGDVQLGDHQTRRVRLHNASLGEVRVRGVQARSPFQGMPLDVPLVIPAGATREVELQFTPDSEGPASQTAAIDTDADTVEPLPLKGFGARVALSVTPQALDFGSVPLESVRSLSVLVQNDGNVPAQPVLDAIDGADAELFTAQLPPMIPPHTQSTLTVSVLARHLGAMTASLAFHGCATCAPSTMALTANGVAASLEVSPLSVDFGTAGLGTRVNRDVQIANHGASAVTVSQVFVTADSDLAFTTGAAGFSLQPGEVQTVTVSFAPMARGAVRGTLRLMTDDPNAPRFDVVLQGAGDERQTFVDPASLDFGTIAVGMSSTEIVTVYNTSPTQNLTLRSAHVVQGVRFAGGVGSAMEIGPGDHVSMPVAYSPTAAGTDDGVLEIVTDEGGGTTVDVPLTGQGAQLPPCNWAARPGALDFGSAHAGELRTLAVDLVNTGSDDCAMSNIQLSASSSSAFSQPDGVVPTVLMHAGDWLTVRVTFAPAAAGSFQGSLQFFVSNPQSPVGQVPLSGSAGNGCLTLEPVATDFGTVAASCPAAQRQVLAKNACSADLAITQVAIGDGDSNEFSLVAGNTGPHVLAAGASEPFTVAYAPIDESLDVQWLVFTLADGTRELATMQAHGETAPTHTDHFAQKDRPKVDQLFVIDNSGSMSDKQDALAANFQAFVQQAVAQNTDFHIAVTTTGMETASGGWTECPGGAEGGEAGRFFPVNGTTPRVLTPTTPDLADAFATNVHVGTCHWFEQGLDAARAALSQPLVDEVDDPTTPYANDGNAGFLRADARLSVIVVSDADDQSTDPVSAYETFFKQLKGDAPGQFIFSAIVTPDGADASCPSAESPGDRYMALAAATGGGVESVCTNDWGAAMARLSASAFGPTTRFPLSARPTDASQITVSVNGQPVTGGWTYEAATNTLVFDPSAAPPAGSSVDVTYPIGC